MNDSMIRTQGSVDARLDTRRPIAVVEDDRDDRNEIRRQLNFLFGEMPVLSFASGEALADYVRGAPGEDKLPWLILLDLHMAGMNGLQTLEFLHSDRLVSDIPVIVTSGTLDSDEVRAAFGRGARAFLPKPLTREGFFQVIHAHKPA